MTERTPTPAHIDAVAGVTYTARSAQRLLTCQNPEVQAALAACLPSNVMLAALTERGALKEVTTHGPIWSERPRTARDGGLVTDDGPVRYVSGWQLNRRLVTPWEVAP